MKIYKRILRTRWQPVEHRAGHDEHGWPNTTPTVCIKEHEYVELTPADGIFLTGKQLAFAIFLVFLIFLSTAIQW